MPLKKQPKPKSNPTPSQNRKLGHDRHPPVAPLRVGANDNDNGNGRDKTKGKDKGKDKKRSIMWIVARARRGEQEGEEEKEEEGFSQARLDRLWNSMQPLLTKHASEAELEMIFGDADSFVHGNGGRGSWWKRRDIEVGILPRSNAKNIW
ncbi:uncharacterized protein THITE_2129241 [Thermothielavioides terrestris NRRL 8126]|uniref:Uncharacterized protein n=1 Tax=Thermothielavioides terrestris (strain ATCC 38088 / NRRL 8126) TaxID=578455 RepID=G2R0Q6_THETT|nr:uncharacterized protein THITE_2129241 [Thermothielavioides terrestris NRRL 8126]AEO67317.1 hypothetical protein THITE_2129241 [Thermothielavioides terrestris NRRL 8126]